MIREQTKGTQLNVCLEDLVIGTGSIPSEAYAQASEKLDDYISTCQEALEMLDFEERAGLDFNLDSLLLASPLSLWVVGGGLELQVKGTHKSGYTLARAKGRPTRFNTRAVLQSALIALQDAQTHCSRNIEA